MYRRFFFALIWRLVRQTRSPWVTKLYKDGKGHIHTYAVLLYLNHSYSGFIFYFSLLGAYKWEGSTSSFPLITSRLVLSCANIISALIAPVSDKSAHGRVSFHRTVLYRQGIRTVARRVSFDFKACKSRLNSLLDLNASYILYFVTVFFSWYFKETLLQSPEYIQGMQRPQLKEGGFQ